MIIQKYSFNIQEQNSKFNYSTTITSAHNIRDPCNVLSMVQQQKCQQKKTFLPCFAIPTKFKMSIVLYKRESCVDIIPEDDYYTQTEPKYTEDRPFGFFDLPVSISTNFVLFLVLFNSSGWHVVYFNV